MRGERGRRLSSVALAGLVASVLVLAKAIDLARQGQLALRGPVPGAH